VHSIYRYQPSPVHKVQEFVQVEASSRREVLEQDYKFMCECIRCQNEKDVTIKVQYSLSKNNSKKGKSYPKRTKFPQKKPKQKKEVSM
jgi:hypothetical protein